MKYELILTWAKEIASEQQFIIKKELYHGIYYKKDHIRNIILLGEYDSKPAVLKVYNDPRFTDEPSSLQAFLHNNTSKKLLAPQLYASKELDEHRGWLIMEHLDNGSFLTTPLLHNQRHVFIDLYLEYKKHFPKTPHRPLTQMEEKDSLNYTKEKFDLWFTDFLKAEALRKEQGLPLFNTIEFQSIYKDCLGFFEQFYKDIPLEWVHGHFKPQELFIANTGEAYLTDFAHTKMVPRGYELAFIIWADQIMSLPVSTPYEQWKSGIDDWVKLVAPHLKTIFLDQNQLQAAICERILGTLLRDFGSSDKNSNEIEQMFQLGMRYLQEVVN